jgi:ATP-dependent helicase YprA (DUF1998 family)
MPDMVPSANAIRQALSDPNTVGKRAFEIAKAISYFLNGENDRIARELVIRALDRRDIFESIPGVLDTFARQVGLFPYTEPNVLPVQDQLAYEYHRPEALELRGHEVVFHREQAEVYRDLLIGQSVVLSAPTSFGKSVIIDALIATKEFSTIVIIVPTIALVVGSSDFVIATR